MTTLNLTVDGDRLTVRPQRLIVAGYTARDEESVTRHIEELAAIGVPPPPSVPMFYDLDPELLSTDASVHVDGAATSGEVEPVLIRHDDTYYLGVGSDHTDRELEREDIAASKAACPKPVGNQVLRIGAELSFPDWDRLEARSEVDGRPYQEGPIAALRHPAELVEKMTAALGSIQGDLVMFCGTLALIGGKFVHGATWSLSLSLPETAQLTHTYTTTQR